MITKNDIERLVAQNGAVIESNPNWPNLESSGWKWKKYADGTCRLWFKGNVSADASVALAGGHYVSVNLNFPFTLSALHGAWASSGYTGILAEADMVYSNTTKVSFRLFRMQSFGATSSCAMAIMAEGLW